MRILYWIFAVLLVVATAGQTSAQSQSPADVISALYRDSYGIGGNSGKNGIDDAAAAKFFDKDLLALYKRAVKRGLDADFFVQGQDFSIVKPIEIGNVSITGTKAKVPATLTQSFKNQAVNRFLFVLVNTNDGWRIHDAFCRGESLSDWFTE